jgi:hypothetical protein
VRAEALYAEIPQRLPEIAGDLDADDPRALARVATAVAAVRASEPAALDPAEWIRATGRTAPARVAAARASGRGEHPAIRPTPALGAPGTATPPPRGAVVRGPPRRRPAPYRGRPGRWR